MKNNNEAKELYDNGIKTLEYCLPFHDSIGISLYHLGHLTDKTVTELHYSTRYHNIHIMQLNTIYQFENNEVFEYYSTKWTNYMKEN